MNQQLFHVLAQTEGDPFQTVKSMAEEVEYCGAGAWIKLLRAHRGKNEGRSQRLTKRVRDVKKRVTVYTEVSPWHVHVGSCLERARPGYQLRSGGRDHCKKLVSHLNVQGACEAVLLRSVH